MDSTLLITGIIAILMTIGLLIWIFNPTEWLKASPNNLYAIGVGNRIWFTINGDTLKWFASIIPIVKPFRVIAIKLIWQEYFEDEKRLIEKVGNTVGGNKVDDLKFKSYTTIPGNNGYLGRREEWVGSLKIDERASFLVEVDSHDGYNFYFIITFILTIFSPTKVFKRSTIFKMLGQDALDTVIEPWGYGKTLTEIKDTNVDLIKDPTCGIAIKVDGEDVDLVTYLDKLHFKPLGFRIKAPFLRILEGENVQEYFKLQRDKNQEQQRLGVTEAYGNRRAAERKIEKDDADQETNIMEDRMQKATAAIIPITILGYAGEAYIAKQRPRVLVEVKNGGTGNGLGDLVNTIASIIPQGNDTASSRKFKKEENHENN